jgi:hypothetical protein
MPQRLSAILGVSKNALEQKGVFNAFVDVDSNLYVDPSLLEKTKIKEFISSYLNLRAYFNTILKLIDNSKKEDDIFWRKAFKMLQFKEFKFVALGYSIGSKSGNAIGREIARNLLITASEIIEAGIKDPIIFELIGLFEKGVGADRISDMTIQIIKGNFIKYTQRVCEELQIKMKFSVRLKTNLPFNPKTGEPIVFTPKEILQDLPMAYTWNDIDTVCAENDELRLRVNTQIGNTWRVATSYKVKKDQLKETILSNPKVLKDLIIQYKRKPRISYDFENDPSGEIIWAELSEKAVRNYPLNFLIQKLKPVTCKNILIVVKTICDQFAKLIESNGWFEFLYDISGKLRHERFAQKLFYGIADQYCLASDLNLSREPNAGSGALDFKITKGYKAIVTVEVKYSSNPSLVKGFSKQLPAYNLAEGSLTSIYLVIRTAASVNSINRLEKVRKEMNDKGEITPEIIIIDGRPKMSASRR